MEGVIVHAEHIYRGVPIAATVVAFIVATIGLAAVYKAAVKYIKERPEEKRSTITGFVITVVVCITSLVALVFGNMDVIHEQVVTIDDTVLFNEFYQHYEIVGQDGRLYTVRELQNELVFEEKVEVMDE